ncbi:hypothetical protein [Actinoplanes philippinensis]|uniref:hypothetical protein n=1 Tax=Actinoplanes philippinensis TaxID=35752 RepID=UPI0034014EB4
MTTPHRPPHRVRRVALLAVAGAAVAAAVAVYADRRLRTVAPPPSPIEPLPGDPPPAPRRPGRRAGVVAAAAALAAVALAVVAITVVLVARTARSGTTTAAATVTASPAETKPMPLITCQFTVATQLDPGVPVTCGYEKSGTRSPFDEPAADLTDPRFFGAALPDTLAVDGAACPDGMTALVVEAAYPKLAATFVQIPGLRRVEPTFQLRSSYPDDALALERAGSPASAGQAAQLDLRMVQRLTQGGRYEWRVKSTPQSVAGGDWSPWCEFTVAEKTSDHLGLDDTRDYTVTRSAAVWRTVLEALGPVETEADGARPVHEPIATAMAGAPKPDELVPVRLTGEDWSLVVGNLARRASADASPGYWAVVDDVSVALGGHPHPTMGFPRTGAAQPV